MQPLIRYPRMTPGLERILGHYTAAEMKLQKTLSARCGSLCAACEGKCCRPEFCQETLESAFLSLVRERHPPASAYDPEKGWRAPAGCALTAGRPPVCYEYFCREALRRQPELRAAGRILTQLGENALGWRRLIHLAPEQLDKLSWTRFEKRFRQAEQALTALETKPPNQKNEPAAGFCAK